MTVKEWLNRARDLDKEIKALLAEKEKAFEIATSVTVASEEERVQASKKNTTENKFISYASYKEMLEKRIEELFAIKRETASAIMEITNPTLRQLLTLRYINLYTWENIALELNYSYKHVVRFLHPKALEDIRKVLKGKNVKVC